MKITALLRNSPDGVDSMSFEGAKDFVRLWIALKERYIERRGFTVGENTKAIPRTTTSDVMRLATEWTRELKRANERPGFRREREKWKDVLSQIESVAGEADDDLYPYNQRFWDATGSLAIYLDSTANVPSRWDLIVESVEESIGDLPGTLGRAARATAAGTADAASLVATGARDLIRGLTVPIVIGAVAVAAMFLLPRMRGAGQ